jgi:hypothetical protein
MSGDGIRHEFAAHYFPGCLEAAQHRWISPQIAVTNRVEQGGYEELRAMNRRVLQALGIKNAATHMEWFFGPKGMKFSEIAARPAGEKIWDMYGVANEFDVYREWALAIQGLPSEQKPNRRYAAGSIQIRPSKDGHITGHRGLDEAMKRCGEWIYERNVPRARHRDEGSRQGLARQHVVPPQAPRLRQAARIHDFPRRDRQGRRPLTWARSLSSSRAA